MLQHGCSVEAAWRRRNGGVEAECSGVEAECSDVEAAWGRRELLCIDLPWIPLVSVRSASDFLLIFCTPLLPPLVR